MQMKLPILSYKSAKLNLKHNNIVTKGNFSLQYTLHTKFLKLNKYKLHSTK